MSQMPSGLLLCTAPRAVVCPFPQEELLDHKLIVLVHSDRVPVGTGDRVLPINEAPASVLISLVVVRAHKGFDNNTVDDQQLLKLCRNNYLLHSHAQGRMRRDLDTFRCVQLSPRPLPVQVCIVPDPVVDGVPDGVVYGVEYGVLGGVATLLLFLLHPLPMRILPVECLFEVAGFIRDDVRGCGDALRQLLECGVADPGLAVEAVHTLAGLSGDGRPDLLGLPLLPGHFRLLLPAPKDALYTCVRITFVPLLNAYAFFFPRTKAFAVFFENKDTRRETWQGVPTCEDIFVISTASVYYNG